MTVRPDAPRVLVIGGLGGLLGRALAPELTGQFRVRTYHRSPVALEQDLGVEWVDGDAAAPTDWARLLRGVDAVVNLAWYRWGSPGRFERLQEGLKRMVVAAQRQGLGRLIQVSVPAAPATLEGGLPYLRCKRAVDRAVAESGLSYRILRPTAMFGPGDVLLGVMLRSMDRYPRFPMFGEGTYHLSPIAASDVAAIISQELGRSERGTVDLGGPRRFEYRELTDLMYELLGKAPRYWRMSAASGRRLARLLQMLGSTLLYAYEVEWLTSDRLGLAPYEGGPRPLRPVEPYLEEVARGLRSARERPSAIPSGKA